jgi:3-oxoacid CoA-transferase B subunit
MLLRMKQLPGVDNLRNYPAEIIKELEELLLSGGSAVPDPKRKGFYDLENQERIFFVNVSPTTGRVMLLATCVLGAFEVAENGDIANWATSEHDTAPAVGGAMDLAIGAKQLWVLMEHTTKDGRPRIVHRCSYPLTAPGAVSRIYTNLAVLDVTPGGFVVREMVSGLTMKELQLHTAAKLLPM